jgi:hypothetical protein
MWNQPFPCALAAFLLSQDAASFIARYEPLLSVRTKKSKPDQMRSGVLASPLPEAFASIQAVV